MLKGRGLLIDPCGILDSTFPQRLNEELILTTWIRS